VRRDGRGSLKFAVWKESLTRNTKTYFLCVFVCRVSWDLMSSQPWLLRSTSSGVGRLTFWYKHTLIPWRWGQCVLPKCRCVFFLSTQRHEQVTCNLHFKYCLYVQKLWTKKYFANFGNFAVTSWSVVMNGSVRIVLIALWS